MKVSTGRENIGYCQHWSAIGCVSAIMLSVRYTLQNETAGEHWFKTSACNILQPSRFLLNEPIFPPEVLQVRPGLPNWSWSTYIFWLIRHSCHLTNSIKLLKDKKWHTSSIKGNITVHTKLLSEKYHLYLIHKMLQKYNRQHAQSGYQNVKFVNDCHDFSPW